MANELEPVRGTEAFLKRFVDNVVEINPDECYVLKSDGVTYGRRVCGAIRQDGKRCLASAGKMTAHHGFGRCLSHDKHERGKSNWLRLSSSIAKDTSLGKLLANSMDLDVQVNDVTSNLAFQESLLLWYMEHVMTRAENKEFDKDDVRFLKELNIDMIHSKESAARIKGSTKLDAIHVKQFVDQIMAYLLGRLHQLGQDEQTIMNLLRDMVKEVFAPMAATGLIQGNVGTLAKIDDRYKSMNIPDEGKIIDNTH